VNNVNNKYLTNSLFASLLLVSPYIAAETQYPAADFQPKVVFQDAEQIAQHSKASSSSASSGQGTSAAASPADSKYPAADFQPKVLFKDENYKPSPSTASSSSPSSTSKSSSAQSSAVAQEESADTKKADKQGGSNWVVLVLLAIAGVVFYSRRSKSTGAQAESHARTQTTYSDASGLTGVAKYINKTSGTGVSRYLDKQSKIEKPATGVAKYMAKQAVSAKSETSEAATGVEKYMRRRG
jgi:hypothetical protein